jgi:hypothetical protein
MNAAYSTECLLKNGWLALLKGSEGVAGKLFPSPLPSPCQYFIAKGD